MRGGGAPSAFPPYAGLRPSALPKWGPFAPTAPERRALRPSTPGDFLPDEKVTKESPRGGHPLWVLPLGGPSEKCFTFRSRSPCGARNPLDRVCATEKDRFATLSRWANRSYFFLWFYQGNTSCCQSVARQAVYGLRAIRRGTPFWGERRLPPLGDDNSPPTGSRGSAPGTPLVPFVVKRKEPRVWAG